MGFRNYMLDISFLLQITQSWKYMKQIYFVLVLVIWYHIIFRIIKKLEWWANKLQYPNILTTVAEHCPINLDRSETCSNMLAAILEKIRVLNRIYNYILGAYPPQTSKTIFWLSTAILSICFTPFQRMPNKSIPLDNLCTNFIFMTILLPMVFTAPFLFMNFLVGLFT